MTALMAPSRGGSFEGILFFVYDCEAVVKEEDPPENAIVYFYPPSASIEERISICGQLIGMSHFMHGFLGAHPALFKLKTEKMATITSGKYTLALGGDLSEPDSLLIRQLETLLSIFTFYHGSVDRMRMMCDSQRSFLLLMNVIWDCYLPFVRHYGEFLPGVFDPLPFLDLPKSVSATCFTKASYILQACQRRQHVLGGCILYSNSILCSQLEPCITKRLLLLKPNQSNHPARPVKTEYVLPFGVRVLNAFLTVSEYLNLYEALAQSPYRKPMSAGCDATLPDLYTLNASSVSGKGAIAAQSGDSAVLSREEVACSSVLKADCCSATPTNSFCCRRVVDCSDTPQETGPRNARSKITAPDEYQPKEPECDSNSTTCATKTSETEQDKCERTGSEIMNSSEIDEESNKGMKQVQNDDSGSLLIAEKEFENESALCKVSPCVTESYGIVSNCTPATFCVDEETRTCALVIQDLIAQVVQAAGEEENAPAVETIVEGYHNVTSYCQPCTAVGKDTCRSRSEINCKNDSSENKIPQTKHQTGSECDTVDEISQTVSLAEATNTQRRNLDSSDEYLVVLANNSGNLDPTWKDGIALRTELVRTTIVCDAFSSRNVDNSVDKHLEKSFPVFDSSNDTSFMNDSGNFSTVSGKSSGSQTAEGVPGMHALPSLVSVEPVPIVHVAAVDSDSFAAHTTLEGADELIDAAQEETEDGCPDHESPLDSGRSSDTSMTPDEEVLFYEEEENGANQVEGLAHINLYVQAHSHVVLILLAEDMLYNDFNTVKALWETSLNELGELEFLVTQSLDKPPKPTLSDEYSFLVYDSFERNMQGSVGEPVFQLDHLFCETTKVMYEQFDNCTSLKDITLRSRSSVMHGKRNLGRGTYFHLKGLHKPVQGVPSPRDPAWKVEKKAAKVLQKDHDVNVF